MPLHSTEDRVTVALTRLIEHLLPVYPDEDDDAADERFDAAVSRGLAVLQAQEPSLSVAPDPTHVSRLIKDKLVREKTLPDGALRFNNLYARLLAQPVLDKKWAVLHFLLSLSNSNGLQATASPPPTDDGADSPPGFVDNRRVSEPAVEMAFAATGVRQLSLLGESQAYTPAAPTWPTSTDEAVRKAQRDDWSASDAPTSGESRRYGPEPELFRDLLSALQGVSSTRFVFADSSTLKLPTNTPVHETRLLHSLAETALLYRDLDAFVTSSEGGLVTQSLRSALQDVLGDYLMDINKLDGLFRQISKSPSPKRGPRITLIKIFVDTYDRTLDLRLASVVKQEAQLKKGGELISSIHSLSISHGDPIVVAFAEKMLVRITKPFYDMLRQWIFDGELSDPFLEFFVSEQLEGPDEENTGKGGATSIWEDKYCLNTKMIPTIVSSKFADKVFLIGKTLNFIRYGCGDAQWVEAYSKEISKESSRELRYGNTAALESNIGKAYKKTMDHLTKLMTVKFKLFEHLDALKRYMLLGGGDFIALLMESLSSTLDQPANTQYRHTLTAQLDHAIRNSNAQYDDREVIRRLDCRMLELSHGEIGWDVFTLEYRIDAPVNVIVTPHGSKQYLRVFNFLWRVKCVEFALGSTWRRSMIEGRCSLRTVEDKFGKVWKLVKGVLAEMRHFIGQLQHYILYTVIDSSWEEMQTSMRKSGNTLDDMVQAHARCLARITHQGLLVSDEHDFPGLLHQLLKTILSYTDAVGALHSLSTREAARREEQEARIATRTAAARWGRTQRDELGRRGVDLALRSSAQDDEDLPGVRNRLSSLSNTFHQDLFSLLERAYKQPDASVRLLAVGVNFNEVYPHHHTRHKRGASTRTRDGWEGSKRQAKILD